MSGNRQTPKTHTLSTAKQLYIGVLAMVAASLVSIVVMDSVPEHWGWVAGVAWLIVYLPVVLWVLPPESESIESYSERPFKL